MTFDTPNGTRGARQPGRNRLERWANLRMADRVRRTGTRRGDILVEVTPEQLHGAERDAAWRQITARARGFAKYEKTTDREIPVIRLTPRAEG